MVDPDCPWWAKLRRAESLIDEIRHASRRSTEQGVAGRLFGRRVTIRISGRAVRRLGDFEEQTDEAAPLGDLREARFRTIRSGQPFAFAERLTRSADDRGSAPLGRSQEAERDNDVRFVLNRLRNVYKHRRLPLLAATLAREGGR